MSDSTSSVPVSSSRPRSSSVSRSVSTIFWHDEEADAYQAVSTESTTPAELPWYRRPAYKLLIKRVILRVTVLSVILGTASKIPWHLVVTPYMEWMESFSPAVSALIFFTLAVPFCGFTPGSYAPTVLAGATFGPWVATPLSYAFMNAGAWMNLFAIRMALRPCVLKVFKRRLTPFSSLNPLLQRQPIRAVILLRLPFLASGILNYVFSLSNITFLPYSIGNLVGFLPGCFLFSLLGSNARSLISILVNPSSAEPQSIIVVVFVLLSVALSIASLTIFLKKKVNQEVEAETEEERIEQQRQIQPNAEAVKADSLDLPEKAEAAKPSDIELTIAETVLDSPSESPDPVSFSSSLSDIDSDHVHLRQSPDNPDRFIPYRHSHREFQDVSALREHLMHEHRIEPNANTNTNSSENDSTAQSAVSVH